jgi:hypothetical protein
MILNHLYGGMDEPELKIIDVFICKLPQEARPGDQRREITSRPYGAAVTRCATPKESLPEMEVRFEPTFCIMATAAIEIKTAIRAYSIAVAPSSWQFLRRGS